MIDRQKYVDAWFNKTIKPPFQTMLGGRVAGRPEWNRDYHPWLRQGSVIVQRGCKEPNYHGLEPDMIIMDEIDEDPMGDWMDKMRRDAGYSVDGCPNLQEYFNPIKSNSELDEVLESIIKDRISLQKTCYPIERKHKMFRFPWTKKIKEAEIRATDFSNACEQWQRNAFAWQKTANERATKMGELQSKVWALEAKIGDLTAVQRKWKVRMSDGAIDQIVATECTMEQNVLVFKDHGREVARFRGECVMSHIEMPLK